LHRVVPRNFLKGQRDDRRYRNRHRRQKKFWKALRGDITVKLESGTAQPRPMTAQTDGDADHGPLWFFASMESDLVLSGTTPADAAFTFVDKGPGIFADVNGMIVLHADRATTDRLWNPFVAAWYAGKVDPKIALLRFDPASAKFWFGASSLFAGSKMLFGADPKENEKDKVAEVTLSLALHPCGICAGSRH
jgi:general stress protein 26